MVMLDMQRSKVVNVTLYGTAHCHLCDEAAALLAQMPVTMEYVDVADDEGALARYGIRIPVVRRTDDGAELDWPFDARSLERFLTV